MAFNHCLRLVPAVLGRRLASPSSTGVCVNQVRNIWDVWPRNDFRALVRDMERQMDRMEREMMRGLPSVLPRLLPMTIDNTTNSDVGGQYRMAVNLAGFKPEDINISLDEAERKLIVKAKTERKGRDGSRLSQEIFRELTLPEAVDIAQLKSSLHSDGVLAIEAPFLEKAQPEPRQIPIQRGANPEIASGTQQQQQQIEQQ